jgi:hypothetical protein
MAVADRSEARTIAEIDALLRAIGGVITNICGFCV